MSTYAAQPPGTSTSTDLPDYSIGFADAFRRGFRKYVAFDGRASRAEFWYWYLFVVGVLLVLIIPSAAIGSASASASADGSVPPVFVVGLAAAGLFYAAVLLPTLAVACRRLHDAGFSGLFLLLGLVTGLIPLIMCLLPTSASAVRYGPPGEPSPYGLPPGGYAPAPGYAPQQGYGGPPAPPYRQQQAGQLPYGQPPSEPQPPPEQQQPRV